VLAGYCTVIHLYTISTFVRSQLNVFATATPLVLVYVQWREAECFLHCPYSFAKLKQLPELRQIISHTCLDAIHAAAGRNSCIAAAVGPSPEQQDQQQQQQQGNGLTKGSSQQQQRRSMRSQRSKSKQRSWDATGDLDLDSDDAGFGSDVPDDSSSDYKFDLSSGSAESRLRKLLQDDESPLLLHLAPGLRLCLAAEVAVGMLCAG
jgi:hypothetical protein